MEIPVNSAGCKVGTDIRAENDSIKLFPRVTKVDSIEVHNTNISFRSRDDVANVVVAVTISLRTVFYQ
jgi:hypothetical protein